MKQDTLEGKAKTKNGIKFILMKYLLQILLVT